MAHPPRHYHDFRETGGNVGPSVEERLWTRSDPVAFDKDEFVHFDIDLGNSEWLFFRACTLSVDSKQLADV